MRRRNGSRSSDIPEARSIVSLVDKQLLCGLSENPDMNSTMNIIVATVTINIIVKTRK